MILGNRSLAAKASEQWLRGILGMGAGWGAMAGWLRRLKKKSKQEGVHKGPAGAERKSEQELRDRTPGAGDCRNRASGQMGQPYSSIWKVTKNKELIHFVFQEKAKVGSTAFMKAFPITQDVSNIHFQFPWPTTLPFFCEKLSSISTIRGGVLTSWPLWPKRYRR